MEAAGGRVIQTDGQRLRYNAKAEVLNPHFLVSGDPTRDWLGELSLRGLESLHSALAHGQERRDHYERGGDEQDAFEGANHSLENLHE